MQAHASKLTFLMIFILFASQSFANSTCKGPEVTACEEQGSAWNCHLNQCLTDEQNTLFNGKIDECQSKPNTAEKNTCMAGLEDEALNSSLYQCNIENNTDAKLCQERGQQWNCKLNICQPKEDQDRYTEAYKNCESKASQTEKEQCFGEIQEVVQGADESLNLNEQLDDKQKRLTKSSAKTSGLVAAIGAVTGIVGLTTKWAKVCIAAGVNLAAGGLAIVNESNNNKQAKKELERLKEDYAKLEEKIGAQGISYELQVEAFEFYKRAANAAERIAGNKKKGYKSQMTMFGAAVAIAAIEAVIYALPPPKPKKLLCAGINGGTGAMGLVFSSKLYKAAKKAEADYKELGEKVERLLELYREHFLNKGGASPTLVASRTSTQAPATQTLNVGRANISGTGGSSSTQIGLNEEEASCATKTGLDEDCSCQRTNSCSSFSTVSLKGLGSNGVALGNKFNLNGIVSDANRITSGRTTASSLNASSPLLKNATRLNRLANKLVRTTLNPAIQKNNGSPIKTDSDSLRKFVSRAASPKRLKQIAANQARLNPNSLVPSGTELAKKVSEGSLNDVSSTLDGGLAAPTSAASYSTGSGLTGSSAINFDDGLVLNDEENLNQSDELLAGEDSSPIDPNEAYLNSLRGPASENIDGNLIPPGISLFKAISNRYNSLRLSRKFGQKNF